MTDNNDQEMPPPGTETARNVAGAILENVAPGLVVDLGAGAVDAAPALVAAGYQYVVIADDPALLADLERRGLRGVQSSVSDDANLGAALDGLGEIAAICLIAVLNRVADPGGLLACVEAYARRFDNPPAIVVAVPNVGQREIALQLLAGRLPAVLHEAVSSGPRHVFTGATLAALVKRHGWEIVKRYNVEAVYSDPRRGSSLALADTLVGDLLRFVSSTFNPDERVGQFVWLLRPASVEADPAEANEDNRPLVSMLMRTQGTRNERLVEALYSAFAQTSRAYEVVICFHHLQAGDDVRLRGVQETLAALPVPLQARIRLIACHEPGRGSPLNAMLDAARGVYISILDDDDLLFEHHVETLEHGVQEHGDTVLFQTFAAQRLLDLVASDQAAQQPGTAPGQYPYTVIGMSVPWDRPVDALTQHHENMIPICCLAVPLRLVREARLRFRSDIEVGEEWAFWMDAMQLLRVVTLPEVTAAVNLWNDSTTNAVRRPDVAPVWRTVRDERHAAAEAVPLLLAGSMRRRLAEAGQQLEELAWLREKVAHQEDRLRAIRRSRFWRVAHVIWAGHQRLLDARSAARRLLLKRR